MAAILRQLPERRMHAYFWVKTLHIVTITAWMAAVFYLPRILVNIAETAGQPALLARLALMGRRLYRFGHVMFGLAFLFGLTLWLHFGIGGGWLHAKLGLVVLLVAYYVFTGRWVKGAEAGKPLPSARALRWFNELPLLLFVAIVFLVLAKPF